MYLLIYIFRYPAALAQIRNIAIMGAVNYWQGTATTLIAGSLLGFVAVPAGSWTIAFDINPSGIVSSNFASIIHLSANNHDYTMAGDRLPGARRYLFRFL